MTMISDSGYFAGLIDGVHVDVITRAVFSLDRVYRYKLVRRWAVSRPMQVVIGLNPSTADALKDDPTILRCWQRAYRMGFGGLVMLNASAYRSTDPKALAQPESWADDAMAENLIEIAREAEDPHTAQVVAAWGNWPQYREHFQRVVAVVRRRADLYCLGLTRNGYPKHPLYLLNTTRPVLWQPKEG